MKKEIIFTLPAEALEGATEAVVVGDFNNWTPGQEFQLNEDEDGTFKTSVQHGLTLFSNVMQVFHKN